MSTVQSSSSADAYTSQIAALEQAAENNPQYVQQLQKWLQQIEGAEGGQNSNPNPSGGSNPAPSGGSNPASSGGSNPPPAGGSNPPPAGGANSNAQFNTGSGIQVSASGGFTVNGQPATMKGMNADVSDAISDASNIKQQFPGMNFIRLNYYPDGSKGSNMADLQKAVNDYTSQGIAVEVENHTLGNDADSSSVGWYKNVANTFKGNNLVMLETSNEPQGDPNTVAQGQIDVIKAIRATGFTNPIGIQPVAGWNQANIPTVLSGLGGQTQNLYVTSHVYDSNSDPNDVVNELNSDMATAKKEGLFDMVDEFGDSMTGQSLDPQGQATLNAVEAANKQGKIGAAVWQMDNDDPNEDSVFTNNSHTQLTAEGQNVKSWLS